MYLHGIGGENTLYLTAEENLLLISLDFASDSDLNLGLTDSMFDQDPGVYDSMHELVKRADGPHAVASHGAARTNEIEIIPSISPHLREGQSILGFLRRLAAVRTVQIYMREGPSEHQRQAIKTSGDLMKMGNNVIDRLVILAPSQQYAA